MKIIYILYFFFLFGAVNAQKIVLADKTSTAIQSVIKDTAIANRFDMIKNIYDGLAEVSQHDQWGYIDHTGNLVVPIIYESLSFFSNGLYKATINEEIGIINKTGRIIVPFGYDSLFLSPSKEQVLILARRDTMLDAFDSEGEILFSCIYKKNKEIYSRDFIIVTKNNLKGIIDHKDRIVLPVEYNDIRIVRNNIILTKNRLCGVADLKGNMVLPVEYGNFIPVKDGKWLSYKEPQGTVVMDEHFKVLYVYPLNLRFAVTDSMFIVVNNKTYSIDNKYGVADMSGKILIPIEYAYIEYAREGFFFGTKKIGDVYEYLSVSGKNTIDKKTEERQPFIDGLSEIKKNNLYGYINTHGEYVIPPIYRSLFYMNHSEDSTGTFKANKDGKFGVVGKDGKVIVPFKYSTIYIHNALGKDGSFCYAANKDYYTPEGALLKITDTIDNYGIYPILKGVYIARSYNNYDNSPAKKTIILNAQSKVLYKTGYAERVDIHYNKFIIIQSKLKCGIVDTSGAVLVPLIYDQLIPLTLRLFVAVKNGKYGVIDMLSGKEIIPFTYTLLVPYYNHTLIACDGNYYGCLDYQGNVFLPFEYDKIFGRLPCKKIIAYKNGKCGVLELNREILIPFEYESIHYYQEDRSFGLVQNSRQLIYSESYISSQKKK